VKIRILTVLAITGVMLTTACGGGGGSSSGVTPVPTSTPSVTKKADAVSSLSFKIPFALGANRAPSAQGRKSSVKPQYISQYSNGGITILLDGQTLVDNASFVPPFDASGNPIAGPGPSGSGTFSYTSTVSVSNGNGYVTVNGNFTTIPGPHTLGVVQTDGPCVPDSYGREQCLATTNGYVLAEGQTTFTLDSGNNLPTSLTLKGVMQGAFLCDAACDGQVGPQDANGLYHLTAYVTDESGAVITQQSDGNGGFVPYDNGQYQIVETDNNGIVTLGGNTGPFTAPGSDNAHGPYGENFTIQCAKVGSTTVAAELVVPFVSTGSVTGYTYSSANYPQPLTNPILSVTGADQYYGNVLNIDCTANGSIVIQ
jgi:hypothetical protein